MDGSRCISCDTKPTRFRVVIDLDTEREIGVVCEHCLSIEFGDTILNPTWCRDQGCAICERDCFYALPEVSLSRESRGAQNISSRFEYSLSGETLNLCDEHLTWVSEEIESAQPIIADGRGYRFGEY